MTTTCNMKMYVHILFCLSFYMKRECIRRSTRKGQIQYKTSGAQKKKKAENEVTMKTKQDH